MQRGNEQSAKKSVKFVPVAKNACMSRITSFNDQNQSTRVEINVLSSYLPAEKLSIPRVNEYEKERVFFSFVDWKRTWKLRRTYNGAFLAWQARGNRLFTVNYASRYEENKKRDEERVARYAPSCVNFFEYCGKFRCWKKKILEMRDFIV